MFYILTRPQCSWCDKAKDLITENGHQYTEYNVMSSVVVLKLFAKANLKTVPQIWYEGAYIGGHAELFKYYDKDTEE